MRPPGQAPRESNTCSCVELARGWQTIPNTGMVWGIAPQERTEEGIKKGQRNEERELDLHIS